MVGVLSLLGCGTCNFPLTVNSGHGSSKTCSSASPRSCSHWVVETLASSDNQFITPVSTLAHSLPVCPLEQGIPSDSTVLVTTSKWVEPCTLLHPCIQDF